MLIGQKAHSPQCSHRFIVLTICVLLDSVPRSHLSLGTAHVVNRIQWEILYPLAMPHKLHDEEG